MATSIALIGPHPERLAHLASISPKNGPKYSPNLYRWMRSLKPWWREQAVAYRDTKTGLLYIGYHDEEPSDWLSGAMLNRILGIGSQAHICAYPNRGFEMIPGFWADYVRLGRCHIDQEHDMYFIGDETRWVFAIWVPVRGEDHLLTTGTHKGTEEGAKHAVAEALRIAAVNLTNDAQAAAVLPARAMVAP